MIEGMIHWDVTDPSSPTGTEELLAAALVAMRRAERRLNIAEQRDPASCIEVLLIEISLRDAVIADLNNKKPLASAKDKRALA
jgi:hypothetical protein